MGVTSLFVSSPSRARCCALVLLVLLGSCVSGMLSPKGVNHVVQALVSVRDSLVDPFGVLDNWDENFVDPCSWTMITCSPDNGLIIGLTCLGTLSPSIGNLTNLEIVILQKNNISGSPPSEIGRLWKLRKLNLSGNSLLGEIPGVFSRLKNLQHLRLKDNNLSGVIPPSFVDMPQLDFL